MSDIHLYTSGKAKRREALAYLNKRIEEEGENYNSMVWGYIIKCIEEEKNGR